MQMLLALTVGLALLGLAGCSAIGAGRLAAKGDWTTSAILMSLAFLLYGASIAAMYRELSD